MNVYWQHGMHHAAPACPFCFGLISQNIAASEIRFHPYIVFITLPLLVCILSSRVCRQAAGTLFLLSSIMVVTPAWSMSVFKSIIIIAAIFAVRLQYERTCRTSSKEEILHYSARKSLLDLRASYHSGPLHVDCVILFLL